MFDAPQKTHEMTWQDRLTELLPRLLQLPLYRSRLENPAQPPSAAAFTQLPFITKRELREGFPGNFLGTERILQTLLDSKEVELEHTSGTSGERLPVLLGRGWWEMQELRAIQLNPRLALSFAPGLTPRRAALTTPVCNGTACHSRWAPRSARIDGSSLAVNQARIPFLLTEDELARMAQETGEWAPDFLDLDPVHGAWFALYCERNGIRFPSLKFVLCSYEFESLVHRRILQRAFGVPAFNLYGSTETGHLLMEDDRGLMKPSMETAFLEVVETDPSGIGELVVTTLTNHFMPLLRYRIGDLVHRSHGPNGPHYLIHGRTRDAIIDSLDRRVTTREVDDCFRAAQGIAHYELRQYANRACRLRFVPHDGGPGAEGLRDLTGRLEELLKLTIQIKTEAVSALVPAPSGKFRLTAAASRPD